MSFIESLARASVRQLVPYRSARLESQGKKIRLDANENPFWREDKLNRYPDPQPEILKSLLSQLYGVDSTQILMTRGSDEGIDVLIRTFCEANRDAIVTTPPTYGMYAVSAEIQGANIKTVPLLQATGFALDKKNLLVEWRPSMKLIFLCSPNNPTGNAFPVSDILDLCEHFKERALVIVDEAYVEFSSTKSLSRYLSDHNNLVILRTLSKAYGLAGARLGCLLAHQEIINLLKKVMAPYPIPLPVIKIVKETLTVEYQHKVQTQIKTIQAEREFLSAFLKPLTSVEAVYPSEANFLLVKVRDASLWMSLCADHDIAIRLRSHLLGLCHCVRISIGTEEENKQLQEVLANV
jgi:histidinol-phosphate aminotransferase